MRLPTAPRSQARSRTRTPACACVGLDFGDRLRQVERALAGHVRSVVERVHAAQRVAESLVRANAWHVDVARLQPDLSRAHFARVLLDFSEQGSTDAASPRGWFDVQEPKHESLMP